MISGLEATTWVIISIWVIAGFLLLPAGSLRYWTAAFVVLLVVLGFGDHLPVRALLVALLALHILFVVPAASRSGQRLPLWMALGSLALLAGLAITGGVRYWLPALIAAVVLLPLGVPLLWARPRDPGPAVEVRLWPRRRGARPGKEPGPVAPPGEPDEGAQKPPPPRNVRQFPPRKRRGPAQNPADRQQRPPAAS